MQDFCNSYAVKGSSHVPIRGNLPNDRPLEIAEKRLQSVTETKGDRSRRTS